MQKLERRRISPRYEILKYGGGGKQTTMVCGAVRFRHAAAPALVAALPKALRIQASQSARAEWMHGTLRLIAAEASELHPGGEAVITRLGDILVIQAIRTWLETDPMAARNRLCRATGDIRNLAAGGGRSAGQPVAAIHGTRAARFSFAILTRTRSNL